MHYTSVTITRVNTTGSLKHRTHPGCACRGRQGQAGCVPTSRARGAAVLHPTEGHRTRELSLLLRTRAKELSKDSKFHLVPVPVFACGIKGAPPCSWHSSSGSARCGTTRVAPPGSVSCCAGHTASPCLCPHPHTSEVLLCLKLASFSSSSCMLPEFLLVLIKAVRAKSSYAPRHNAELSLERVGFL